MSEPAVASTLVRVIGGARPEMLRAGALSPLDRGFSLGDAIFETIRVYRGKPFRLQAHLDRLRGSASLMSIPVPANIDAEIASVLAEGAAVNLADARLRVTLSRGAAAQPGLAARDAGAETVVLAMDPIALPRRTSSDGITAVIAQSRRNEQSVTAGHKVVAFADAILELSRAQAQGADDCIFLDTQGHLSEGSTSNVFVYDGETLITPMLACGALPGITRAAVLELARRMALPVEERVVEREELLLCREAFLTSSIREIAPLVRVDGVGRGEVGELTREIIRGYGAMIDGETG